jgi:hypothetical protein
MHPGATDPISVPGNSGLRAGDDDRQRVADRLKTAVDEGRLGLDEYDARLTATYAARTYGELAELTADLPPPVPEADSVLVPVTGTPVHPGAHPDRWTPWRPWLTASVITTVIWILTGLDGEWSSFWPVWVIVPWGLVLLARTWGPSDRHRPGRH